MSTEAERLAELVTDLGHRLAQAFGDVISPDAQRHLHNAQREALTALFLIYEEQLGRRTGRGHPVDDDEAGGRRWPRDMDEAIGGAGFQPRAEEDMDDEPPPRPPATTKGRTPRVTRIDLD